MRYFPSYHILPTEFFSLIFISMTTGILNYTISKECMSIMETWKRQTTFPSVKHVTVCWGPCHATNFCDNTKNNKNRFKTLLLVDIFCFVCPVNLLLTSSYKASLIRGEMCCVVGVYLPYPPRTAASHRDRVIIQIWSIESPSPWPLWLLPPWVCVLSQANQCPPQGYSTRNVSSLLLEFQTTELPVSLPPV